MDTPVAHISCLSDGEVAAINDLTHRTGVLHVDRHTSTVRVQCEDGHDATYDLDSGHLLSTKTNQNEQ